MNEDKSIIVSLERLKNIASRLQEITTDKAVNYNLIGSPFGASLEHCIFLGIKYCPNFEERVKYYVALSEIPASDPRYKANHLNSA